jgi:outer membrane protein OmpA-like peptidoglycan-associated protein
MTAAFASSAMSAAEDANSGPTIHSVAGMVVTHTAVDAVNRGDGESVWTLKESTADSELWTSHYVVTGSPGAGSKEVTRSEEFLKKDLISARRMICWYMPADPVQFPGYTPCSLSFDEFKELQDNGNVTVNVGWINPKASFGMGEWSDLMVTRKHYRGVLSRVDPKPVLLSVLVNGKPRDIPTVHVHGHLSIGDEGGDAEFWVQDDPLAPIFVKESFLGTTAQLTRVDLPPSSGGAAAIEQGLSQECHVNVPGIYFPTNSAAILSPSKAELDALAATLLRHSSWKVSVEGHTDNVGTDVANADLSARRAQAVRSALIERRVPASRISAEGFGAKQPIADNDSVTGRARNRRVELRRDCAAG